MRGTKKCDLYSLFKKYKVTAESITDFLATYHRNINRADMGEGFKDGVIQDYVKEFDEEGFCFIPASTSKTGDIAAFYGEGN
jgi:hypothetical protein